MNLDRSGSESSSFIIKLQEGKRWPKGSKARYVLTHVVRAHSTTSEDDNDVWCCVLRPPLVKGYPYTEYAKCKPCLIWLFLHLELNMVVATAGGNSVCMIDVGSARVVSKFKQVGEEFFAIAWTVLNERQVIAAAGS